MKKLMLFMLALVSFAMFSCVSEQPGLPNRPISKDGVLFKFTLPGGELITRSVAAVEGENAVNDMTIFFFEPTTNGTGKFIAAYKTPAELLPDPASPEQTKFTFEIESMSISKLVKTNPYSILIFANMKDNMFATDQELDNFIAMLTGMSENEVMNYASIKIQGVPDTDTGMSGGMNISNLPMSAQAKKEASIDVVDVQLIRTLSRFDVVNATSTHKVMSVSIWNAFTESMVWEKGYMDYNKARTRRFYGRNFPTADKAMFGGLYAFENASTMPDQNDTKTTCLIIGIQPEAAGGTTTYYRVNINSLDSGQYLKRNNVYQLTIQDVLGAGEGSEVDAYIKGKILLKISINSWDRDEDGLIIRDGDNLLAIPTRKARFSPEAETRQYYVYTLGTGTLELVPLDMPEGMKATLGGAKGNDLFISVDAFTFDQRKGSIELRFAGMKGIIEIIQSGATEKSLKLSHTTVPVYPAGKRADMVSPNPILINSSGEWTAEIYGTDFSFSLDAIQKVTFEGDDGSFINNIYSRSANGEQTSRTNFVLITLDEDPDNYRNVLVLTQAGTGGFTLTPNNTTLFFEANKELSPMANNVNKFDIETGEADDTWIVEMMPGLHADKFLVEVTGATAGVNKWKGNGSFVITAKEVNYSGKYLAKAKITHNEQNTKEINITQDSYGITARLINLTPIPSKGGDRSIEISTTASQSLAWTANLTGKAEIVKKGLIPYFADAGGNPIMDGTNYAATITGMTPATIKVGMMGINQDIRAEGAPTATVNVALTIDPTVKADLITIKQDPVTYYSLYGQSTHNYWGSWASNTVYPAHFKLFNTEIQTSAKFGPTGTVYTKSTPNVEDWSATAFANNTGESRKRLINVTYGTPALNNLPWETLRKDDHVVFVINDHNIHYQNVFNFSGFGAAGFFLHESDVPHSAVTKLSTDASVTSTEIYKWLVRGGVDDGPFGAVSVNTYSPRSYDGNNTTLSSWSATFIPLIKDPRDANRCFMGIDPTLRIIYVGDTEMFGKFTSTAPYNETPDAIRFLNNLQAWIVMTNNYGDAFNERFKIK